MTPSPPPNPTFAPRPSVAPGRARSDVRRIGEALARISASRTAATSAWRANRHAARTTTGRPRQA